MARPDEPATADEVPELPEYLRSGERRRLLRGGLAAGPVILTIVSRPVLGQVNNASMGCSVTTCASQNPDPAARPI